MSERKLGTSAAWDAPEKTLLAKMISAIEDFIAVGEGRMPNDGMTKEARMTNVEGTDHLSFGLRHSFDIRISSFVILKVGLNNQ
jgi:hypothetical protein